MNQCYSICEYYNNIRGFGGLQPRINVVTVIHQNQNQNQKQQKLTTSKNKVTKSGNNNYRQRRRRRREQKRQQQRQRRLVDYSTSKASFDDRVICQNHRRRRLLLHVNVKTTQRRRASSTASETSAEGNNKVAVKFGRETMCPLVLSRSLSTKLKLIDLDHDDPSIMNDKIQFEINQRHNRRRRIGKNSSMNASSSPSSTESTTESTAFVQRELLKVSSRRMLQVTYDPNSGTRDMIVLESKTKSFSNNSSKQQHEQLPSLAMSKSSSLSMSSATAEATRRAAARKCRLLRESDLQNVMNYLSMLEENDNNNDNSSCRSSASSSASVSSASASSYSLSSKFDDSFVFISRSTRTSDNCNALSSPIDGSSNSRLSSSINSNGLLISAMRNSNRNSIISATHDDDDLLDISMNSLSLSMSSSMSSYSSRSSFSSYYDFDWFDDDSDELSISSSGDTLHALKKMLRAQTKTKLLPVNKNCKNLNDDSNSTLSTMDLDFSTSSCYNDDLGVNIANEKKKENTYRKKKKKLLMKKLLKKITIQKDIMKKKKRISIFRNNKKEDKCTILAEPPTTSEENTNKENETTNTTASTSKKHKKKKKMNTGRDQKKKSNNDNDKKLRTSITKMKLVHFLKPPKLSPLPNHNRQQ